MLTRDQLKVVYFAYKYGVSMDKLGRMLGLSLHEFSFLLKQLDSDLTIDEIIESPETTDLLDEEKRMEKMLKESIKLVEALKKDAVPKAHNS